MGFHLPSIRRALFAANQVSSKTVDVPKGYLAAYVGDKMKRFVIPVSYLNQPSFQELCIYIVCKILWKPNSQRKRLSMDGGHTHEISHGVVFGPTIKDKL